MKNWLITADLHIDDYSQCNYENRSRLNQFLTLADRYVELANENNCDTLVLCGDTVNRPTNRPYVLNVVQRVLQKLSDNFTDVYYIFGQHDLDSKTNDVSRDDSLLTALEFPNFHYMDHKQLTLESGIKVAFKDWTPKQDVSWIDGEVDVLFAHFTKSTMFGQDIDESKFKLMIHGDIHNSQEIGKYISIGTPLQKDMSSQQRGTVLIFNPNDATYKRIGTDDSHTRFLRIDYVSDQSEEGFEGPLWYHIYRPKNVSSNSQSNRTIIEWTEIDTLISELVEKQGLGPIHSEIKSMNPELHEIDFNFKLRKLIIHGYRSVEDLTINFSGNDRILLLGDNGSGKSSIVRALKSVFEQCRYINAQKSDFTDEVKVTLDFDYQNKNWKLTRGSHEWGILVDGEPLNYNNKTEFEADVVEKLPFIHYLDLMFIMSGTNNLSAQFTPDRRIELLSKFYRLDRVESYCNMAQQLAMNKSTTLNGYRDELNKNAGALDNTNKRLEELSEYAGKTQDYYQEAVDVLNKLQDDYNAHEKWKVELEKLQSQLKYHNNALEEYEKRLSLNVEECNEIIESNKSKAQKITEAIQSLQERQTALTQLTKDRDEALSRAKVIKKEIDSLESGICPTCGSKVCNEHTKSRLAQLNNEAQELKTKYLNAVEKLKVFKPEELQPRFYVDSAARLKKAQTEFNDTVILYSNKLTQHQIAVESYNSEKEKRDNVEKQISSYKLQEPKQVIMPIDFKQKLMNAMSELAKFEEYSRLEENRTETELSILSIKSTMADIQNEINRYNDYVKLTSRSGLVMEMILRDMAESFTDSQFKYEVDSGVFRGKPYTKFNSYFNVKGKWRLYEDLSDGQKTVSDVDFLSKLFSLQVGLLVLDETLKHLDFKMGPIAFEKLSAMNVNTILISTHDTNFTQFTQKINLELGPDGRTIAYIS